MYEEINEQLKAFLNDWSEIQYKLKKLVDFFEYEVRLNNIRFSSDEVIVYWAYKGKIRFEHIHYKDEQRLKDLMENESGFADHLKRALIKSRVETGYKRVKKRCEKLLKNLFNMEFTAEVEIVV